MRAVTLPDGAEPAMPDVAIVGAGLCGLALARLLHQQGQRVVLIDARDRVGGRAFGLQGEGGPPLDAGPTWFWPETEPRITALLGELGLASRPQYDPGDALWLTDPNREPERREEPGGVHQGAHRIQGGVQSLVQALQAALPPGTLRLQQVLRAVHDQPGHIELHLEHEGRMQRLRARRVVLALPPRLIHERVEFAPALPAVLSDALAAVPTWMAAQAKALVVYDRPFWREDGHSGQAFVRHAQAVLGEVFDACGEPQERAALGGFCALPPVLRESFRRGMPMLVESQLAQLFGPQAQFGTLHWFDWAEQPWTCSTADRAQAPQPPQADPLLRRPHWQGRLHFGGTETAAHGAGHMEGALDAAARLLRAMAPPRQTGGLAETVAASDPSQPDAWARYHQTVATQREAAPAQYRRHLTRLLAAQDTAQLTQRALLATVEQAYSETLDLVDELRPAWPDAGPSVGGRHALTPALLAPFEGWNQALLQAALAHNAGSCALSNFPDEHRPDDALLRVITRDLAAAWREFALALNDRLMVVEQT